MGAQARRQHPGENGVPKPDRDKRLRCGAGLGHCLEEIVQRLQLVAQIFGNALARKQAGRALRESEARMSLAAESAEAGLWELDCNTGFFWATERARGIFGYASEEVIAIERFEASVLPDDLQVVRHAIERALKEREPINVEYRIRLGDGGMKWIASRGRPNFKLTGEPERLMGQDLPLPSA
jgi:formate hydrogenlyase transcriptional activator